MSGGGGFSHPKLHGGGGGLVSRGAYVPQSPTLYVDINLTQTMHPNYFVQVVTNQSKYAIRLPQM